MINWLIYIFGHFYPSRSTFIFVFILPWRINNLFRTHQIQISTLKIYHCWLCFIKEASNLLLQIMLYFWIILTLKGHIMNFTFYFKQKYDPECWIRLWNHNTLKFCLFVSHTMNVLAKYKCKDRNNRRTTLEISGNPTLISY